MDIRQFVEPWSPWLDRDLKEKWGLSVPTFRRPIFGKLVDDLFSVDQIISIIGPRRVGKSTLMRQLVKYLIKEKDVDPTHIIYYSFDDPTLSLRNISGGEFIESLYDHVRQIGEPAYLLLDEIQTLERWEQYLKKYYDLKYPIKVVVSGSASSPIFKKSRESLLGRVKDHHILPFSFREYVLFHLHEPENNSLKDEMDLFLVAGENLKGMLTGSLDHIDTSQVQIPMMSQELWDFADKLLGDYFVEGGFPEVWKLPTEEKKIEYLYDNQIKKVIYEDLVLATEFRKPEQLKMFYISLLEKPGQEVNVSSLSKDIGVGIQQIEKYLPLLEMTDLIAHVEKFRKSSVRVRKGSRKFYLIDLALRNCIMRTGRAMLKDDTLLGLYAENLVFNALRKWDGILQIDYYREKQKEVDFIVHTKPTRYWPIEVKYRNRWISRGLPGIVRFRKQFQSVIPAVITKKNEDYGYDEKLDVFQIPLVSFLMMFD